MNWNRFISLLGGVLAATSISCSQLEPFVADPPAAANVDARPTEVQQASAESFETEVVALIEDPAEEPDAKSRQSADEPEAGSASPLAPPLPLPLPAEGSLTLADLQQRALESNPTLQQAAAIVEKARGVRQQVGLYPNPVIGYQGEEIGGEGTAGQQGGFISQMIVTADKLDLNRAVAGWDLEAVSWQYQTQRYRVLNDVKLRFYEVLGAQRRIEIATELVRVADQGRQAAEALYKAKQGAQPDVLQAQIDLNEVQIILRNAQIEYEASWKRLAALVGQPGLAPRPLQGTLEGEAPMHRWEDLYAQLLETSPEIQTALARVQRARTQIRRQRVQPIPNLLASAGTSYDYASGDNLAGVQIGIPLPVFNRNQGNIAVAEAEYNRAVRDLERLQLELRDRLALVLRDFRQARQQVRRYEQEILPTARENLALTEEGYKQGEFDFLRVLTARRSYFETNLRYVDSLIALRQTEVVLDGLLLTGGLDRVMDVPAGLQGVGTRGQAFSQQ